MKKKLPVKRIIAVLSISFVYLIIGVVVVQCQDLATTQLLSSQGIDYCTETTYNSDNMDVTVETEVSWWKAGINEYNIIEEIRTEPVETTEETTNETTRVTSETTRVTSETTRVTSETTRITTEATTSMLVQTTTSTTVNSQTQTEETTESTTETTPSGEDIAGETLSVYNIMTGSYVEDDAYTILCQVVYNEVGSSFNIEAIKAQAVASYTFIKYYNQRGKYADVGLKPNPPSTIKKAVAEVTGIACYYNGGLALTTYFASSAGSTVSCKDVYGTNYSYLSSVESKYDYLDPNYGRVMTMSESDVRNYIESYTDITLSSNPSNWFTLLGESEGGVLSGNMVGKMLIDGNSTCKINGVTYTITGRVLRERIFKYKLRSACFDVSYSNGTFTFTTYGYGHGVGMSQHGANLYALYEGWNYVQILEHYYHGVNVK